MLVPREGIKGSLFVYLYADHHASEDTDVKDIGGPMDMSKVREGKLVIKEEHTKDEIVFQGIRLLSIEDGVTRSRRFRFLEFWYPDRLPKMPDLTFKSDDDTKPGGLGNHYKISINTNEFSVPVLGARSLISGAPNGQSAHRFWKLAYKNSFLKKVFSIDSDLIQQKPFPKVSIDYDRQPLRVDEQTLSLFVVELTAGFPFSSRYRSETLIQWMNAQNPAALLRLRKQESSHQDVYLSQVHSPDSEGSSTGAGHSPASAYRWVETITLMFTPGNFLTSGIQ
jgi:hypothetical protein